MTTDPICLCGDPQGQHKMRKGGCRAADCGCDRYEVDEKATAEAEAAEQAEQVRVLTAVAEVCEDQAAKAQRLLGIPHAEAEAERLAEVTRERDELEGIVSRKYGEIQALQAELARLRDDMRTQARVVVERNAELEQLRIEYAQARDALDREKERRPAPAAAVLYAYDAWSCLVDGGCGARYTRDTATTNHPCGQLTPVTVTITHRTEGAPPA